MSSPQDAMPADLPAGDSIRAMLHAMVDQVLAARLRDESVNLREVARAVYEARRARNRILPPALLGEPAWDMLLDLFANHPGSEGTSTKSACLAADVPYSTAWRCLNALEADGLVERTGDAADARRSLVRLTERGEAAVRQCVAGMTGLHGG